MRTRPSSWQKTLTKLGLRTQDRHKRWQSRHSRTLRLESLENRCLLAITVDNPIDELDTDRSPGDTSLREAIFDATLSENTIDFDPSTMNGETIELLSGLGELKITDLSLTIDASMLADGLTIDANDPDTGIAGNGIRIFNIIDTSGGVTPPTVTLKGLTLTGADPSSSSNNGQGGAIRSAGFLKLHNMNIVDNVAREGAGVYVSVAGNGSSRTVLTIDENSQFEGNAAIVKGGAALVRFSSQSDGQDAVEIADSLFSSNTAGDSFNFGVGGAFVAETDGGIGGSHSVVISSTVFEDNSAHQGGAIFHLSSSGSQLDLSILKESVLSGNEATSQAFGSGGAVYSKLYGSHLQIKESTISGNTSGAFGGGIETRAKALSSLTIEDCEILSNTTGQDGGGLFFKAYSDTQDFPATKALTISRSSISGNMASNRGGGVYTKNFAGTETLIEDTRITGSRLSNNGGGLYAYLFDDSPSSDDDKPRFTITRSTVDDNEADNEGGGIFVCGKVFGDFIANNSTVSNNRTSSTGGGGGIFIARFGSPSSQSESVDAFLHNITVTQNTSNSGGGVAMAAKNGVRVRINNSIISENFNLTSSANNLVGRVDIANSQYNLVGTGSTILNLSGNPDSLDSTNSFDDAPLLSPLAYNGGYTPTHAPKPGSPVIDAGSNALAVHPITSVAFASDQRGEGFARIYDTTSKSNAAGREVDIGSHEVGLAKVVDVVLYGSNWARDPYSMNARVAAGEQLLALPTAGINTIEVHFSEYVSQLIGTELLLKQTTATSVVTPQNDEFTAADFDFSPDANMHVGTWTLKNGSTLANGKYAILLDDTIENLDGDKLDGEWDNPDNGTPDDYADDASDPHYQPGKPPVFKTGNGTPGGEDTDNSGVGEFRFHFAVFAGDYDGNNLVDNGDLLVWQQENGKTNQLNNPADGDGDGDVDTADYGIWEDYLAEPLPLWTGPSPSYPTLDYFDNEIIDFPDFIRLFGIWQDAFGSQKGDPEYNALVDFNADEDIDGFDYLSLVNYLGFATAWYIPPEEGSLFALVGPAAPQVSNVIISGSASLHDPFSFDTVDGSGSQLATVPVGAADTVSIVFSEGVNVTASSLLLIGLTTATMPTLAEFAYDTSTNTATWRFEGWALGDNYLLSLSDGVTDSDGNHLDGEWTNPASISTTNSLVSEFPSGDGNPGGSFNFFMTLLPGDANLDGVVNSTDGAILLGNLGQGLLDAIFTDADFNGDGQVTASGDGIWLTANLGTNLQTIWALADLDGDFDIDYDDLGTINFNLGLTGATWEDGDLNGDGEVTMEDLDLAFLQFGLELDLVA